MAFHRILHAFLNLLPLRRIVSAGRMRRWSRRSRGLFYGLGILLVVWLNTSSSTKIVQIRLTCFSLIEPVFRPVHLINETVFIRLPQFFKDWTAAYHRIEAEEATRDLTRVLQAEFDELKRENEDLRRLLNASKREQRTFVTARVLGIPAGAFARNLLVSTGDDVHLAKDLAVATPEGLVGRVIEAVGPVSRVLLLTDVSSRIPVVLQPSGIHAIAAGDNSDTLKLLYQQEDGTVDVGDKVLSSGYGGIFPSGIPLGVVTRVAGGEVVVKPWVDCLRLRFVKIMVLDQKHPGAAAGALAATPSKVPAKPLPTVRRP